jgi:hypothetical protein
MEGLLGIRQLGTFTADTADINYIKQDLPYVPTLDTVKLADGNASSLVVKGRKLIVRSTSSASATDTSVLGTFASDGSTAVVQHTFRGGGRAVVAAFPVGLAYFDGAIPLRPVDRGSTDSNMNHFCPHEFTAPARDLLASLVADLVGVRPVIPSDPLVEVGVGLGRIVALYHRSSTSHQIR